MVSEHIVKSYDKDLLELAQRITEMGGMVETMLTDAVQALVKSDTQLAQNVIASDPAVDNQEREIAERTIFIIARRQPMADDLRFIVSSIRLSADIERIGDLAKNISKRVIAIGEPYQSRNIMNGIAHLGDLVLERLQQVLNAYASKNVALALDVWHRDNEIDALHNSLFRELLTYMMEDPRNIGYCTHLLFCAKNIERMGDHCTNIAETVYYLVTGSMLAADRPKTSGATSYEPIEKKD